MHSDNLGPGENHGRSCARRVCSLEQDVDAATERLKSERKSYTRADKNARNAEWDETEPASPAPSSRAQSSRDEEQQQQHKLASVLFHLSLSWL